MIRSESGRSSIILSNDTKILLQNTTIILKISMSPYPSVLGLKFRGTTSPTSATWLAFAASGKCACWPLHPGQLRSKRTGVNGKPGTVTTVYYRDCIQVVGFFNLKFWLYVWMAERARWISLFPLVAYLLKLLEALRQKYLTVVKLTQMIFQKMWVTMWLYKWYKSYIA